MNLAVTLSFYICRQFAAAVIAMLLALSALVAMFDFIELLRRSASKPDATFGLANTPLRRIVGGHFVLLAADAIIGTYRGPRSWYLGLGVSRGANFMCASVWLDRHWRH